MSRVLKVRYIERDVTVPAATLEAAPLTTNVSLGNLVLDEIDVQVPAGHAFLTGLRFVYAGTTILPYDQPTSWLKFDDLDRKFEVDFEQGGPLQIVTFNTDIYDHTFYLRFRVSDYPVNDTSKSLPLVAI